MSRPTGSGGLAHFGTAAMVGAFLAGCGSLVVTPLDPASRLPYLRPGALRHFDRVVIIVLENETLKADAIGDPYMGQLPKQGAYLAEFHGLFHNSYPNYLAMVAGTIFDLGQISGGNSDHQIDWPADSDHRTIADELEAKGLRWKSYAEDYPARPGAPGPFLADRSGDYRRKHVPLLSFKSITETGSGKRRFDNVVSVKSSDPKNAFAEAVRTGTLPEYSFYTPNMKNDGHDSDLQTASRWLQSFLSHGGYTPPAAAETTTVADFGKGTLIVITFDEAAIRAGHNRIYTTLLGDVLCHPPGGHVSRRAYNHYNVLSTIEQNFGLTPLAEGDRGARPIDDVWPGPTPGTCSAPVE